MGYWYVQALNGDRRWDLSRCDRQALFRERHSCACAFAVYDKIHLFSSSALVLLLFFGRTVQARPCLSCDGRSMSLRIRIVDLRLGAQPRYGRRNDKGP